MEEVIFERPDSDERCEGWILFETGDLSFLMIPDAVDGKTPLVVVAKEFEESGVFYQAENYWLNDDDEGTLRYLSGLMEGATLD